MALMPTTGPALRAERRAADITVTEIAARMGLSRHTVHVMERAAVITVERATLYHQALTDAIKASQERVA